MDKFPGSEAVKLEFVDSLEDEGFQIHKRDSFLKWKELEAYLIQKEELSALLFIKVFSSEDNAWGVNKEFFESYLDLVGSDEDTTFDIVFLDTGKSGYSLDHKDFDSARATLEVDEDGDHLVTLESLSAAGARRFDTLEGFISLLS